MKKQDLINIIALGVLILGLGIGLTLIKQSQEIRRKAAGASDILVSLSPASAALTKDQKTTVSVVLTNQTSPAKDISLYSAGVDLQFDTNSFTVSNVTCNNGFLSSAVSASTAGNKISLSCFAPGGSGSKTIPGGSQVNLGSFDITALDKPGTTDISFTRANVPDATTSLELSGGTGTGGSYTISGSTTSPTSTPNPTATPTPAPTATSNTGGSSGGGGVGGGLPNACGGTCGSDVNCQSGLYCYQGFCRKPACPNSTNCVCPVQTPTPKPISYLTAKPTQAPQTPAVPAVSQTPFVAPIAPAITPEPETPTPSPAAETLLGRLTKGNILLFGGAGTIVISFLVVLILTFKKKSPPTPPPSSGYRVSEPVPEAQQYNPYSKQPSEPAPPPPTPQSPPPPAPPPVNFIPPSQE